MQLSDFFAPLQGPILLQLGVVFLCWEIIGTQIANWLQFPPVLRLSHWVVGMGLFVFISFLSHFIWPMWPILTWATLFLLTIPCASTYFKQHLWKELIQGLWAFPYSIIIFFLYGLAKPFFYHVSLPPRVWDDMAYHFYSPYQVFHEPVWNFSSDMLTGQLSFYGMLPRLLDTAYILLFSMTKTYASAQVLHLVLVLTAIWTASWFLRRRVGWWSGIVFSFLCLGLNTGLLLSATTGYVDAGSGALALLFLVALSEFVITRNRKYLFSSVLFWGMAIGTKYTNLVFPIVSSLVSVILVCLTEWRSLGRWWSSHSRLAVVRTSTLLLVGLVLVGTIFGGYWYVKNWAISQNPVYPFVFGCQECREEENVLNDWGYAEFSQKNQALIIESLFYKTPELYQVLFIAATLTVWLAIWKKKTEPLFLTILILITIIGEIFLVRLISPFELRFFYHWQLLIPFILSLPFQALPFQLPRLLKPATALSLTVMLAYATLLVFVAKPIIHKNLESTTDIESIDSRSRAFVLGNLSLTEWIRPMMPGMLPAIEWCGQPRSEVVTIYVADPEIIWNYDGLARIFFVNCRFQVVQNPLDQEPEQFLNQLLTQKPLPVILSAVNCHQPELGYKDPLQLKLSQINKALICRSQEIEPHLFQLQPTDSK